MEGNAKSGTAGGLLEMRVCRSKTGRRRAGNRVMPAPAGASRRLGRHELGLTMVWGDARRSSVRCGGRAELCARERTRGNLHGLIHPASPKVKGPRSLLGDANLSNLRARRFTTGGTARGVKHAGVGTHGRGTRARRRTRRRARGDVLGGRESHRPSGRRDGDHATTHREMRDARGDPARSRRAPGQVPRAIDTPQDGRAEHSTHRRPRVRPGRQGAVPVRQRHQTHDQSSAPAAPDAPLPPEQRADPRGRTDVVREPTEALPGR